MKKINEVTNGNQVDAQELVYRYVLDPDNILSSDNGLRKGVYCAYVVISDKQFIPMFIGETGENEETLRERIQDHLKYWVDNPEQYCGVKKSELDAGTKFLIKVLEYENDYQQRHMYVQSIRETVKPYLQCGIYSKFNSKYRGFDLCIFPTYRRRAFIVARDGYYHEDRPILDKLIELEKNCGLSAFVGGTPDTITVGNVEFEMPNGSDTHCQVKEFVEKSLGITSTRGCNYRYLVKIVATALDYMRLFIDNDFDEEDVEMYRETELSISEYFDELDIDEDVLEDNVYGF